MCLSFIQNVEVRKSELLRVHCIKLLKETVLKLDSGLGLFIAVLLKELECDLSNDIL